MSTASERRIDQEVEEAIARGYLVYRGSSQFNAYFERTYKLGVVRVVLREYRKCCDLSWDAEVVHIRSKQQCPESSLYPVGFTTAPLEGVLRPFLERADSRHARLRVDALDGRLSNVDRDDGYDAVLAVTAWLREMRLPPPMPQKTFDAHLAPSSTRRKVLVRPRGQIGQKAAL